MVEIEALVRSNKLDEIKVTLEPLDIEEVTTSEPSPTAVQWHRPRCIEAQRIAVDIPRET